MITGEIVTLRPLRDADEEVLYGLVADLGTWEENTPAAPTALTRAAFADRFRQWLTPEAGKHGVRDRGRRHADRPLRPVRPR